MIDKMDALIVDDEDSARRLLKKLVEETNAFNEVKFARSAIEARNMLLSFDPDLIFLDIKMPEMDGFEFIQNLPEKAIKPEIVFVTAYDQYAVKAIKNQAFDYLLKPVNRSEFKQCISKFLKKRESVIQVKSVTVNSGMPEKVIRLKVNNRNETLFINPDSILYCKAEGNYTTICTGKKKHLCSLNLGKVEGFLKGNNFIRIGRSHIINFEYITLLDRKESIVTLSNSGETVTVKIPRQHIRDLDKL